MRVMSTRMCRVRDFGDTKVEVWEVQSEVHISSQDF